MGSFVTVAPACVTADLGAAAGARGGLGRTDPFGCPGGVGPAGFCWPDRAAAPAGLAGPAEASGVGGLTYVGGAGLGAAGAPCSPVGFGAESAALGVAIFG